MARFLACVCLLFLYVSLRDRHKWLKPGLRHTPAWWQHQKVRPHCSTINRLFSCFMMTLLCLCSHLSLVFTTLSLSPSFTHFRLCLSWKVSLSKSLSSTCVCMCLYDGCLERRRSLSLSVISSTFLSNLFFVVCVSHRTTKMMKDEVSEKCYNDINRT